jgi:peptide deformylase
MALRKIVQVGDDVLRKKCFEVTKFDEKLHLLLDDMKETLQDAKGAGLAGPQVGVLRRIFIVDIENEGYFEMINPVILSKSGSQYVTEGCLSVRGKWGELERPNNVTVKYQDRFGKEHKIKASGFFAQAICHENDHLDGVLYIDKADCVYNENEKGKK